MGTRIEHTFAARIDVPEPERDKPGDLLNARGLADTFDLDAIDEHLRVVEAHPRGG